jgi:integrase
MGKTGARSTNVAVLAGRNPKRLGSNPLSAVERADASVDCRRKRRTLTEGELVRLLDVACQRPLIEAMTIRRGKRKGQLAANVRDDVRRQLELLGRERALIYKTLVLTGLRRGELASLTVGQLDLHGPLPSIVLNPAVEKNREGNTLPLRRDLAGDLALWVKELEQRRCNDSRASDAQSRPALTGVPPQGTLPLNTPVFNVPAA